MSAGLSSDRCESNDGLQDLHKADDETACFDADASQVEFYFSDSNLPRDKFLRDKIQEDPEVMVTMGLVVADVLNDALTTECLAGLCFHSSPVLLQAHEQHIENRSWHSSRADSC